MAGYRKFDGERYKNVTFSPRKTEAKSIQKNWKDDGYKVRIVPVKNGYELYARKK